MSSPIRLVSFRVALLVFLFAALTSPLLVRAQRDDDESGRYVSHRYGYALSYDTDEWSVASEDENPYDRFDRIYLTNGLSLISVTTHPDYNATQLADCAIGFERGVWADPRAFDIELLDDPDASGDEDGRAWLTLDYAFEQRGSDEQFTTYIECFWFNDVAIAVRQDVAADDYDDQVDARDVLLRGLSVFAPTDYGRHGIEVGSGGDHNGIQSYEPDLETYASPMYGYTITYDSIMWRITGEDVDPDDAYDLIEFSNGPSLFAVWGDPDYDEDEMADCVTEYLGFLGEIEGVEDIEPYDGPDAVGEDDGRAWETVTYVFEFREGAAPSYARYIECIWLGDGVTAVVIHEASSVSYEFEIPHREALVERIEPA